MSNERLLTEEEIKDIGLALFKRLNRMPTYGEVAQETAARVRQEVVDEIMVLIDGCREASPNMADDVSVTWAEAIDEVERTIKARYLAPSGKDSVVLEKLNGGKE